jgi:radical SAM protein with 4Fe4S-binding SPASM domain
METIKLAPSLGYIMKAFWPGELGDFREDEFGVKPLLTYCLAGNRTEYVFTGPPSHSIYMCAECTGLSKFRVGTYYPSLSYDADKKAMWGIHDDDFYAMRSVDRLDQCRSCKASLLCGGYCALEAIVENGCADHIYCKDAPGVITNFLSNESARFYRRSSALLQCT